MTAVLLAAWLLLAPIATPGSAHQPGLMDRSAVFDGPSRAPRSGFATYCAPTPRYCQGWGNGALLGAVRSFRFGDKPYWLRVTSGERSVVVRVVSFCACGRRHGVPTVVDLSPAAFQRLAPLNAGIVRVQITRVGVPLAPQTDVAP